MIKTILHLSFIVLFLLCSAALRAQEEEETPDPTLQKRIEAILQVGIGAQPSNEGIQFVSFSVERPLGLYKHLGLQFNSLIPSYENYPYGRPVQAGSFEICVFSKFFLHGRLTGRKSAIFFGPELSYSMRNVKANAVFSNNFVEFTEKSTKYLLRWGVQYKIGLAILEITLPFGIESVKSPFPRDTDSYELPNAGPYRFNLLSIRPGIQLDSHYNTSTQLPLFA